MNREEEEEEEEVFSGAHSLAFHLAPSTFTMATLDEWTLCAPRDTILVGRLLHSSPAPKPPIPSVFKLSLHFFSSSS